MRYSLDFEIASHNISGIFGGIDHGMNPKEFRQMCSELEHLIALPELRVNGEKGSEDKKVELRNIKISYRREWEPEKSEFKYKVTDFGFDGEGDPIWTGQKDYSSSSIWQELYPEQFREMERYAE